MWLKGVSGVFFEIIVVSGLCLVMLYGVVSYKVIEKGELIILDFGCYYEGYVFDMIWIFVIGSI